MPVENPRPLLEKIYNAIKKPVLGIVIGEAIATGVAGCEATSPKDTATGSETAAVTDTLKKTPGVSPIISISPSGEVTISPSSSTEVSPQPTSSEAPKNYDAELEKCKPELKSFCEDMLRTYDTSGYIIQDGVVDFEASKFQNFLKRDAIINFGETGNGLNTIDIDGKPMFCMVNLEPKYEKQTREAVKQWLKDAPNFLDSLTSNGLRVFFMNKFNPAQGASASYNGNGVLIFNCGDIDVQKGGSDDFIKKIRIHLGVEAFGIKSEILGGVYCKGANGAAIKQILAHQCCEYLYKKTNDQFYADRARTYQMGADNYLSMCENPEAIPGLVKTIQDNNLMAPYGSDSWADIVDANN